MYEKKLPNSTFNKSVTMETEHSLIISFFQKIQFAINFRKSHRVSLQLLKFHQSSQHLKSARPPRVR